MVIRSLYRNPNQIPYANSLRCSLDKKIPGPGPGRLIAQWFNYKLRLQ